MSWVLFFLRGASLFDAAPLPRGLHVLCGWLQRQQFTIGDQFGAEREAGERQSVAAGLAYTGCVGLRFDQAS